jgi:hypothetical protein
VRGGKVEVTRVLRGYCHDRARAVAREDVVGDVDRDALAVERVDAEAAGEGPALVEWAVGRDAFDVALLGHLGPQVLDGAGLLDCRAALHEGVLGREHDVGHAEPRVGPGRVDLDGERRAVRRGDRLAPRVDQVQGDARAVGPPDPVALHGLDPFRPVEPVERVEQLVGVVGDLEEPLLEAPPLDHVARAFARAVTEDLLVREDRLTSRAPVDRCLGAVGEPRGEQAREDDLVPAHVGRVVAADLAAPVVDGTEPLHAGL